MSSRTPGRWLLAIARVVFDEFVLTTVVHQAVADMRDEWLRAGTNIAERVKALGRGYVAFWVLVAIAPIVFGRRQTFLDRVRVFSQFLGSFDMAAIRRLRFIVILFVIGLGAGYVFARSQPVLYTSSAVLRVVPAQLSPGILDPTKLTQLPLKDQVVAMTAVLLSRTHLEQIVNELNLYEAERKSMILEEVLALMRRRIVITPGEAPASASDGQIVVSYTGSEPVVVMKVASRLAGSFIENALKDSQTRADRTAYFIENEVDNTARELLAAQKRLRDATGAATVLRLEVDTLEASYKTLLARRIDARMNVNLQRRQIGEQIVIVDEASLPQVPIGPTRMQVSLLGGAAGIATAVVLAFLSFLYGVTTSRRRDLAGDVA